MGNICRSPFLREPRRLGFWPLHLDLEPTSHCSSPGFLLWLGFLEAYSFLGNNRMKWISQLLLMFNDFKWEKSPPNTHTQKSLATEKVEYSTQALHAFQSCHTIFWLAVHKDSWLRRARKGLAAYFPHFLPSVEIIILSKYCVKNIL